MVERQRLAFEFGHVKCDGARGRIELANEENAGLRWQWTPA
jgi:hypothetical protein